MDGSVTHDLFPKEHSIDLTAKTIETKAWKAVYVCVCIVEITLLFSKN